MASETGTTISTARDDWDKLIEELFTATVAGTQFGIGIAGRSKSFLGSTLKLRLNQRYGNPQVTKYIHKSFGSKQLDKVMASNDGLESAGGGLFKVVGDNLGLPRNTLMLRFNNPNLSYGQGAIFFGGQRLEGHLERRVQVAQEILSGARRPTDSPLGREDPDELKERLGKINVKRLFEYDVDLLSRLVNGLEDQKEDLPKKLKPVYKTVSDYILKKKGLR